MQVAKRTPAADAYSTHRKFWADTSGDIALPVDPYALAESMGIKVFRAVLGPNKSGYLTLADGTAAIYVNEALSPVRNRFTVAHEVGHYVDLQNRGCLEGGGTYDRDDISALGTDPGEVYANRFAAALLMPREAVERLHRERLSLQELASRFRVSVAAMENRLKNLNLAPAWQ